MCSMLNPRVHIAVHVRQSGEWGAGGGGGGEAAVSMVTDLPCTSHMDHFTKMLQYRTIYIRSCASVLVSGVPLSLQDVCLRSGGSV